jgi:uncharacterized membrane protein YbhN (UPF0104 family)
MRRLLLFVIGGTSFAFMVCAIFLAANTIFEALRDPGNEMVLGAATSLYLTGAMLLGFGWLLLTRMLAPAAGTGKTLAVFFLGQAARYIPGNVAHVFGRVSLAKETGLSALEAGALLMVEFVTFATLAVFAALYLTPQLLLNQSLLQRGGAAAGGLLVVVTALVLLARYALTTDRQATFAARWSELRDRLWRARHVPFLFAYCLIVAGGFFLFGLFFRETLRAIDPAAAMQLDPVLACVTFAAAWLVGFVTPGAPAGIGVREAALVALLAPIAGNEASLAVAALSRILSVICDVILTLLGAVLYVNARSSRLGEREKNTGASCSPGPNSPGVK